jgi:tetratricopeptide (TPR) repeat protein
MTDWQLGLRAFREGRMREATDRLRTAANDYERTVTQRVRFQTLAFLGAALYALGDPGEAVGAFEQAVRLSPTATVPADLNVNLANAYLAVGKRDQARLSLQQALKDAPGHVEARMLLQRLENSPQDQPIAGSVLGETPEGVKNYVHTLTFARVGSGGYDPAQVRQALQQIERYIDFLIGQINQRDDTITKNDELIARYKEMEERFIERMIMENSNNDQMQDTELFKSAPVETAATEVELSPIERLFQKKS